MKRSGPIRRKSPLKRGTTPLRNRSTKRARQERVYSERVKVWKLENPRCCFPGCSSATRDCHHAAGREGELLLEERHWRPVCRRHHDWIGENGQAAKALGLRA